ncbi:non-seed lectin-like [Vicia villosa]|uniref:non-seed lectin-like n=1 Tax=Vicia villosa TaxID=3911 RepID=UPI00273CD572|nr:non-seed lectin-like [Vicia villosa]
MAFYRTNLPTQELFFLVLVVFVLLATNINSVQALSFSFTKFSPRNPAITLQGDAQILSNGVLALTNSTPLPPSITLPTTGRTLYTTPLTLWDNVTGNVASFVTSFSFAIANAEGRSPTDGLVFFIAPKDTVIPDNSDSLYFGVVDSKTSVNQFVGVEFDLYSNSFDPYNRHIGIDINSLISTKTVKWNWVSGSLTKVTIIYDSPSNALTVVVTYANGKISTISQAVDLKAVLPNIVRIGFSATSINGAAHNIHSWSFRSNLEKTTSSVSDI